MNKLYEALSRIRSQVYSLGITRTENATRVFHVDETLLDNQQYDITETMQYLNSILLYTLLEKVYLHFVKKFTHSIDYIKTALTLIT